MQLILGAPILQPALVPEAKQAFRLSLEAVVTLLRRIMPFCSVRNSTSPLAEIKSDAHISTTRVDGEFYAYDPAMHVVQRLDTRLHARRTSEYA